MCQYHLRPSKKCFLKNMFCISRTPWYNSIPNSRVHDNRRIAKTSEKLAKSLSGPLVELSDQFPGGRQRSKLLLFRPAKRQFKHNLPTRRVLVARTWYVNSSTRRVQIFTATCREDRVVQGPMTMSMLAHPVSFLFTEAQNRVCGPWPFPC